MATSVPVPMAMPTSAAARAGASLRPSPAKTTRSPRAWWTWTSSCFVAGVVSAWKRVELEFLGDGAGGGGAVAGDHDDFEAEAAEFGEGGGRGGFDRVFEGDGAGELAVGDDADDGGAGDGVAGGPRYRARATDDDLAAADFGADAEAGGGGESATGGSARLRSRAAATMARASGCSLGDSAAAARVSSASAGQEKTKRDDEREEGRRERGRRRGAGPR